MIQVWQNYLSDLGRAYPLYSLSVLQVNNVDSDINPINLLPVEIQAELTRIRYPCGVGGITPRTLSLWVSDGANFKITYPVPFSQNLADYLTTNIDVQAWEFIGETIKYGRLRRMLENV